MPKKKVKRKKVQIESYDPIQRAIDIQLSGIFNKYKLFNIEDLIINFIDLKYHRQEKKKEKILYYALQGYKQEEIANLTGYSLITIKRMFSSFKIPTS